MKDIFKKIKGFISNEDGLGTLEILLIVAVLVGIALLFRENITAWVSEILNITDTQIDQFDPANSSDS